ncbi:MAG: LEA type 2 family protein [Chitinophagales bacterium]
MKISYYLLPIFALLILFSCGGNSVKNPELKQFDNIKVTEFKKKNVEIQTTMRYYNPNDFSIMVTMADFDITVNGKDVGTFISKNGKEVNAGALLEIPVSVSFAPEDAFEDFDAGILKIKSDHVATVEMEGYLSIKAMEEESNVEFEMEQLVLFSNDNSISIDENGNIVEN